MEQHTGKIVERAVRRNKVSISELARRMRVNRRSVYNWFNQKSLRLEIICKIGYVLGHDFSVDLPEAFGDRGFEIMERLVDTVDEEESTYPNSVHFWMTKYISLLEKYNELLAQETQKSVSDISTNARNDRMHSDSYSENVFESLN